MNQVLKSHVFWIGEEMKTEITDWCRENFGPPQYLRWEYRKMDLYIDKPVRIQFWREQDALLTRIRWNEYIQVVKPTWNAPTLS